MEICTKHFLKKLVRYTAIFLFRTGKRELDYGHMAKQAVENGPQRFRKYNKVALSVYCMVINCQDFNARIHGLRLTRIVP